MVALFLALVLDGVSLRGSGRVLELLAGAFGWKWKVPHWTTGRLWLLRLGLHQLTQAKEAADDWAWLIDHSVQIGRHKCLVIVGLRLSRLPAAGRCLAHGDMKLIALEPMESSTAPKVEERLEAAVAVTGVPRLIVSDHGADLHGGVRRFQQRHPRTVEVYDTKHKAACLIKRRLEKDEHWKRYQTLVGRARVALQQTELAWLSPPGPRLKARFMNLGPLLDWGEQALAVLQNPPPSLEETGRRRLRETLGELAELVGPMRRWRQEQQVIKVVVERVGSHGLYAGAAADLELELNRVLPPQTREAETRELAEELTGFVAGESAKAAAGERFPGSTEVLESLFGRYKELEKQQAKGGFTSLLPAFGALVCRTASRTVMALVDPVRQALAVKSTRSLAEWCSGKLGPTLRSLRQQALAAATNAQQKSGECSG